jgi:lyso-ornithine lipid O-acyltransferase
VVSLFPEGTTNDGKRVLPFKTSYFSLVGEQFRGEELVVQPAAIRYVSICGMPLDCGQRHKVAWYGDMELVPHAAELLRLGSIRAEIIFLPPLTLSAFENRKELASHCQSMINQAIE